MGLHMRIEINNGAKCCKILMTTSSGKSVDIREVDSDEWGMRLRRLGNDFVELAL